MCLGAGLHAKILFHIESNGYWLQNVSKTSALILSIEKIEADTVTVSVQSDSDGINFYYELCFERILTGAV